MKHGTFLVSGMTCGHCRASVVGAITALDERARVNVNLETGEVQVESELSPAQIVEAIVELGYGVSGPSTFTGADR